MCAMGKHKGTIRNAVYFCVILILVLLMIYSGLQILESTVFGRGQEQGSSYVSKTLTRDGVDYYPRRDISVILVMGIDRYGVVEASDSYNNPGDVDMVMLLIFDETNEKCDVLYLNRDTMLEMPVLGIGGKQAGTYYGQLALAHTYGSGLEDSCENVVNTLTDFLPGVTIDYYISMNMDAISILNDAVGGVTVTVKDDFSDVDPSITMGQMTLHGEQAINYVRTRKNVGDQKNITRMERQKEYVQGFLETFKARAAEDNELILRTYEEVSPYLVTNCSTNAITGMLERYAGYELGQIVIPEGENVLGEEYYEFYVDEDSLDTLLLELIYSPKR